MSPRRGLAPLLPRVPYGWLAMDHILAPATRAFEVAFGHIVPALIQRRRDKLPSGLPAS